MMKRSIKSKRVSWAPGINLCQVAVFRKEESPSQVGLARTHRQIKPSCNYLPDAHDLPPGFEGTMSRDPRLPSVKWRCPPKFAVDPNWHVAAGEESREVVAESLRESKVLEAVYPYQSSIPFNPCVSKEVLNEVYDDSLTPVIPIIPIEEIESYDPQQKLELPAFAPEAKKISEPQPSPLIPPPEKTYPLGSAVLASRGPDAAAAPSAAFTSLLKGAEQQGMVDMNLLVKILSDPKMVGKLMADSAGNSSLPKSNTAVPVPMKTDRPQAAVFPSYGSGLVKGLPKPVPVTMPIPSPASCEAPAPAPRTAIPFPGTNNPSTIVPVAAPIPASVFFTDGVKPLSPVPVSSGGGAEQQQPSKGMEYYKNLIRQHGAETTQQNMDQTYRNQDRPDHQKRKLREMTSGKQLCSYFNTPRGCRRGNSCPFLHVPVPPQWQTGYHVDEPNAKRIRLGPEIMGR